MQFVIPATFVDSEGFKEGLSPTITIRQRDDKNLVYIDKVSDVMEDKGLGDYVYIFYDYQKDKLYTYKIDGGSDDLTNRYLTGNNELDYFSNKEDWGIQVRGAIGGFSSGFYDRLDKFEKLLELLKPKEIDFTEILTILQELKTKEYPIQDNEEILTKIYELENKLGDKSDKMEIISTIKSNEANSLKTNEHNKELIANLLEQIKSDSKTINELKKYVEKLIRRGDIETDPDFRRIIKKIKKEKEKEDMIKEIELQLLIEDEDFKSLLEKGQSDD